MFITDPPSSVRRVTVTLDPIDVDLLDRLGKLEGLNRSEELRGVLRQLRPVLEATVNAFESAHKQKDAFERKAAEISISGLQELIPEVEKLNKAYLGAMSRIEGAQTSAEGGEAPASNTGATLD